MHLAVPKILFVLPRRVWCPVELRPLVLPAIDKWNGLRAGLFVAVTDQDAEVRVEWGAQTWVEMPIASSRSVLHWGETRADRDYWMAHEIGHTLGLGDHVWVGIPNFDKYVNPQVDSIDDGGRYRGVMSYLSPPEEWFGPDDIGGLRRFFPLAHRLVIPGIAAGGA